MHDDSDDTSLEWTDSEAAEHNALSGLGILVEVLRLAPSQQRVVPVALGKRIARQLLSHSPGDVCRAQVLDTWWVSVGLGDGELRIVGEPREGRAVLKLMRAQW